MNDIECPYCGHEQEVNHDDGHGYSEDELHQQQCTECDKYFVFTTYISYSYTPHQADAHKFKPSPSSEPVNNANADLLFCSAGKVGGNIKLGYRKLPQKDVLSVKEIKKIMSTNIMVGSFIGIDNICHHNLIGLEQAAEAIHEALKEKK